MEHTIFGLTKKRGEIAGQHKAAVKAVEGIKADLEQAVRAFLGLTSRRHQFGEMDRSCCVAKCGNAAMREVVENDGPERTDRNSA